MAHRATAFILSPRFWPNRSSNVSIPFGTWQSPCDGSVAHVNKWCLLPSIRIYIIVLPDIKVKVLIYIIYLSRHGAPPPQCCYFVAPGGLACLEHPRGYASWSLTPGRFNHAGQALRERPDLTQHIAAADAGNISVWTDLVDDPVMWCPSQSPGWTYHGPTTRNALVSVLCHLWCGYPLPCDAASLACHDGG